MIKPSVTNCAARRRFRYDAEYARDLGYAAVTYLMAGGSGAMITMQNGEINPVPFNAVIDLETGRGKFES